MALRIIESQVIQAGGVLRWSGSTAWVQGFFPRKSALHFSSLNVKKILELMSANFSSPPGSHGMAGLSSAHQLALVSSADLKRVHASTFSKSLIKVFSRTGTRTLLQSHFLLACRQIMTHSSLLSEAYHLKIFYTSGWPPLQSIVF